LVLLLRDSGYEARFLPVSALTEPSTLKGVRLLLLVPTRELSAERWEALLASVRDLQEAEELLVLELVTPSSERREEGARDESWHMVPWPLRIEELERRIEAALRTNAR
jgi:hypothetical protein